MTRVLILIGIAILLITVASYFIFKKPAALHNMRKEGAVSAQNKQPTSGIITSPDSIEFFRMPTRIEDVVLGTPVERSTGSSGYFVTTTTPVAFLAKGQVLFEQMTTPLDPKEKDIGTKSDAAYYVKDFSTNTNAAEHVLSGVTAPYTYYDNSITSADGSTVTLIFRDSYKKTAVSQTKEYVFNASTYSIVEKNKQ